MAGTNLGWRTGIICCHHCRELSVIVLPVEEKLIECPQCDRITRLQFRRFSKANARRAASTIWVFERTYFDNLRKVA